MKTTILNKKVENGRLIISINGKTIVNIQNGFNPKRNIVSKLEKMGLPINYTFEDISEEIVFVSKKDAKAGDYVKLFGDQTFQAYELDGKIKFKRIK
jgi:hypothetical protein